jgi:hypothetical protein
VWYNAHGSLGNHHGTQRERPRNSPKGAQRMPRDFGREPKNYGQFWPPKAKPKCPPKLSSNNSPIIVDLSFPQDLFLFAFVVCVLGLSSETTNSSISNWNYIQVPTNQNINSTNTTGQSRFCWLRYITKTQYQYSITNTTKHNHTSITTSHFAPNPTNPKISRNHPLVHIGHYQQQEINS